MPNLVTCGFTIRRILPCLALLALPLLSGCGGGLDMARANANCRPGTGFMVKSAVVNGQPRNYGLYVPPDYASGKHLPVIVFLHGLLEGGSDGTGGMSKGLGPVIAEHPERYPFVVVFPQSGGTWSGEDNQAIALADLDQVQKEYGTDPDRVILTGVSTGGYGTWSLGAHHPERFAALVPMCGEASPDEAPKLVHLPVWCFHGGGDILVFSGSAKEMCNRINAGGGHAKFSEVSFGHNISPEAYSMEELPTWMLSQKRGAVRTAALP